METQKIQKNPKISKKSFAAFPQGKWKSGHIDKGIHPVEWAEALVWAQAGGELKLMHDLK